MPVSTAESPVPYFDAAAVTAIDYASAADAVLGALRSGLDVTATPPRSVVPVAAGQLLLMPAEYGRYTGIKVASVTPENPARGLPRIQGSFLLLDGVTHTPVAIIDGPALTTLRTPAVSAAAVQVMAPPEHARLVVLGAGPQAAGHIRAICAVTSIAEIVVISRDPDHAEALVAAAARDHEIPARAGTLADCAGADIVVTATTSTTPILSRDDVRAGTLIVAVGSHEPTAAELSATLVRSARVVVEDTGTALREAGDVIAAIDRGALDADDLVDLSAIVTGRATVDAGETRIFKSTGMAWEDVVVAARVFEARDPAARGPAAGGPGPGGAGAAG